MKMEQLVGIVGKSRSVLTGTYVSHSVDTTTNGTVIEKHTVLLGSKPVEFSKFCEKGSKAEDIKPPAWAGQRFPLVVIIDADFEPDLWSGRARIRATCDTIDALTA